MSRYDGWPRAALVARLQSIDDGSLPRKDTQRKMKPYDVSKQPKRKIALKFCYQGWDFCGLEKQKDSTPLPTVESVLEAAMIATRLIDPVKGIDGAGLSKSGRTDRGVSAAGQVVTLWVRSMVAGAGANDGRKREAEEVNLALDDEVDDSAIAGPSGTSSSSAEPSTSEAPPVPEDPDSLVDESTQHLLPTMSEIPYVRVINQVLPASIRVLAWSPVESKFDARFNCIGRHYKYFFRLHPHLNLDRMREAAARLPGTHDWRNFCKLDGSKGDINYVRTVVEVSIDPAAEDESGFPSGHNSPPRLTDPSLYVLNVKGWGFLWHQIRHIAAILFLVGQGLEEPSIVTALLNVDPANPLPPFREGEPTPPIIESKPNYEMADPLPLVLWDCRYPEEQLNWQHEEQRYWEASKISMESVYTASLMRSTVLSYFTRAAELRPSPVDRGVGDLSKTRVTVDMGGGRLKVNEKYKPLLTRERGDTPDEAVRKYREGRAVRRAEKRAARTEEDGEEKENAEVLDE